MKADARPVEPRRKQVVDREIDARGVQLLEDRTHTTDRLAIRIIDPGELDQRRLERLEGGNRARPAVAPVGSISLDLFRVIRAEPVLVAIAPPVERLLRDKSRARQHPLLVLNFRSIETAELPPGAVEDNFIAVRLAEQYVEVDKEPAPLA